MSEPMTTDNIDQRTFDYVRKKLEEQGCPSITIGGECAYRGLQGEKCAVGWLIPDALYNDAIEETPIGGGSDRQAAAAWAPIMTLLAGVSNDLIDALQSAHDDAHSDGLPGSWRKEWRAEMRDIAKSEGLKWRRSVKDATHPTTGEP